VTNGNFTLKNSLFGNLLFLKTKWPYFRRAWGLVALGWRFILQIAGHIEYYSGKHYEKKQLLKCYAKNMVSTDLMLKDIYHSFQISKSFKSLFAPVVN
jgi:hypothetical protein